MVSQHKRPAMSRTRLPPGQGAALVEIGERGGGGLLEPQQGGVGDGMESEGAMMSSLQDWSDKSRHVHTAGYYVAVCRKPLNGTKKRSWDTDGKKQVTKGGA